MALQLELITLKGNYHEYFLVKDVLNLDVGTLFILKLLCSQKMKFSEAKRHSQVCLVLHLNFLLAFVLRLEEQVKHHLGAVAGAYSGGSVYTGSVNSEWMRGSEMVISDTISKIDTVINETTDLRQKMRDHEERLALLEGKVISHGDLPMTSKHASLQSLYLPEDISRRLTNVENGSSNIEFLMAETGRELNNIKQEVRNVM